MSQVTATVRDPNGNLYTNAKVEAIFIPFSGATQLSLASGSVFPTFTVNTTDSFGVVSMSVTGNDLITPAGSQWRFSVISSTTPTVGFSVNITITGSTQDISAALQAAAAPLPLTTFGNVSVAALTVTGALTGGSVNTSVYVAPSGNIQTAINALPSGGGEVQLSPGLYPVSAAIVPKNGTHIRCTNTGWANTYDTAGCVIQPATGNAIFAISGPAAGTLTNFKMTDVTIDLTADSSALGGVNLVRSLYSELYNVRVLLPALGAMDGFRWDGTAFSYWNKCFGCTVDSIAPGAISNTHNGFHYTAAANSNWCYGCVTLLINNAFLIDGATSQVGIFGGGSDHFAGNCISVQGTARGNLAKGVRCEESFQVPTGAAVNIGATAVENTFEQIYVVGAPNAAAVVTDASGGKNTINVTDTSGAYASIVFGNNSQNESIGINKTPTAGIALDINGRLNMNNFLYQTLNGLFRLDGNTNGGVEFSFAACDATDTCRVASGGAGGIYFATSGGASAFGFQPTSFGNAFVPAADNTYQLGANTRRWSNLRFAGNIQPGSDAILISSTAPTIAAAGCGGGAASISSNNGTAAFKINVGTTPGSACTITMPTATTGWNCKCDDITTQSTAVFVQKQTGAESTTSVTITNFNDVAVATAFVASDILKCSCFAD